MFFQGERITSEEGTTATTATSIINIDGRGGLEDGGQSRVCGRVDERVRTDRTDHLRRWLRFVESQGCGGISSTGFQTSPRSEVERGFVSSAQGTIQRQVQSKFVVVLKSNYLVIHFTSCLSFIGTFLM